MIVVSSDLCTFERQLTENKKTKNKLTQKPFTGICLKLIMYIKHKATNI